MRSRWRWILLAAFLFGIAVWYELWKRARIESSQDSHIRAAAARYGVSPALVKAIVWRESHFNPRARGKAGEIGLMQIREATAQEWAEAEHIRFFSHWHLLDPAKNTQAGTWYLRKLLRRYPQTDDPLPYALADYNAGRSHVLRWAKGEAATNSAAFVSQITYPGTRSYIRAVVKRYHHYQRHIKSN